MNEDFYDSIKYMNRLFKDYELQSETIFLSVNTDSEHCFIHQEKRTNIIFSNIVSLGFSMLRV